MYPFPAVIPSRTPPTPNTTWSETQTYQHHALALKNTLKLIQPLKHTNCKAQTTSILVIITWCYIDVWKQKSAYSHHFRNSVIGEESACKFKQCSSTIVVTLNCGYAILSWCLKNSALELGKLHIGIMIPTGHQDTDLVLQCTHLFQGCRICKTGNGDVTLPHHVSRGFPQPSSLLSKGPALLGTSIR